MALEKKQLPYEFLARWRDGQFVGAHVQFITVLSDNGAVVSETIGDAMPVDVGAGQGFPIADILSQMHVDALAAMDKARAEVAAVKTEAAAKTAQQERIEKLFN